MSNKSYTIDGIKKELASISPTIILLYPHVLIGRYPQTVSLKQQSQHTTDDIYQQRKEQVAILINKSEEIFNRLKHM